MALLGLDEGDELTVLVRRCASERVILLGLRALLTVGLLRVALSISVALLLLLLAGVVLLLLLVGALLLLGVRLLLLLGVGLLLSVRVLLLLSIRVLLLVHVVLARLRHRRSVRVRLVCRHDRRSRLSLALMFRDVAGHT